MGKIKKIFVACGSGVATSQTVASKIASMCEDENLPVSVEAVDIKSLESIIDQCDIYVSIVPLKTKEWGKPTLSGIPFLTGMGIDAEFEKLKEIVKAK
ncbi:PTS sugar transporter subunit IIB [Candidatus Clostridium radicumherbarum]|uniref:PTS sugar transporter subunit IIB n=1 Tax=Candidatus Clostridium radicumherbarum TaxID=3381662 RepID=A0ABW8TUC1_9CLOT